MHWSTATETNNDYFTLERSSNGTDFEAIGIVDGAGNSSTILQYEFIDVSPSAGGGQGEAVYYRLKQTDFNGKFEYFDPIAIENCTAFAVFPNPAENELQIQFFSETEDEIMLEVYNVVGQLIQSRELGITKGNNLFRVDISSAAGGVYVLKAKTTKRAGDNRQRFIKTY